MSSTDVDAARARIAAADRILLTAGAGLSAAAGYDYTDAARFAELFPELHRTGFSSRLQFIDPHLPDEVLWGFWARHLADIRFDPAPNPLYRALHAQVAHADVWVMTSNVDALFARNGFDADRVFTPQGDYGAHQCFTPCSPQLWPTEPLLPDLLDAIDERGGVPTALVPRCPNCGGRTFLNVNVGANYVHEPHHAVAPALQAWLDADRDADLLVLEIGAGPSTPGVIRFPGERIVAALGSAHLLRVNPTHAGVPTALGDRATGLSVDVADLIGDPEDPADPEDPSHPGRAESVTATALASAASQRKA